MANEEKIITMLENMDAKINDLSKNMDAKINDLNNKVDIIAKDFAETKLDVAEIKSDIVVMKEDIEELKENSEITRTATNKLLDWAERVEKSTVITTAVSIPPLTIVE